MTSQDTVNPIADARGPTLHDRISRAGLHLSKAGRGRHQGDARTFYQTFFNDKHVDEARYDLRQKLRRNDVAKVLSGPCWSGIENREPGSQVSNGRIDSNGRIETSGGGRKVVVDIGLGVGDIIASAPRQSRRVGLAYSAGDLALAQALAPDDIEYVRGSALDLPFGTETVDAVLFLEVMEHLKEEGQALAEISRVLKPAGLLIISVPGNYYFPDYLELIGHYRHYTREHLLKRLADEDISVVQYIDQHYRLAAIHYYPYMLLATLDRLLNYCGRPARSLYVRPVIGRIYGMICSVLDAFHRDRTQEELASDSRSTFVVARKNSGPRLEVS